MSILFLIIFHYLRQVLWPFEYCSSDTKKSNESWLFVHTADNAQVTNTTIVMPMTNDIFSFTDRPYRKHLYMNGTQYASLWSNEETNSFYTDPPNAVLTWVDGDEVKEVEVVITDADFDGDNIIYTVENSNLTANQSFEDVSLFVDSLINEIPQIAFNATL